MTGRSAPLRVVRGVALAVTSATLAVAAHAVGGGMVPDVGLLLLPTLGLAAVGVALADRRRGLGVILPTLGAAQLATHTLLSLADSGMPADRVDPWVMTGAHAVAVVLTALLLTRADGVVFRVARALARLLPAAPVELRVPDRAVVVRPVDAVDRARVVLLCLASPRRGPPVPVRP